MLTCYRQVKALFFENFWRTKPFYVVHFYIIGLFPLTIELKFVIFADSVRWPKGTYALPMPVSGCPKRKKAPWSEGFLKQNTEDTTPLSNWSRPTHLKGLKKHNVITQHFCVKEKKGGSDEWPAGKYCIYKKGKCPLGKGLKLGFVNSFD